MACPAGEPPPTACRVATLQSGLPRRGPHGVACPRGDPPENGLPGGSQVLSGGDPRTVSQPRRGPHGVLACPEGDRDRVIPRRHFAEELGPSGEDLGPL